MTRRPPTPGAVLLLLLLLLPACAPRPKAAPATNVSRSPTTAPTTAPTDLTERVRLNQWLSGPRQWQDLQAVAQFLHDDRPDVRASALIALLNLWETSGARTLNPIPVGLNAEGVIAELADYFTTLPLRYRGTALGIVNALGADRAQAVPLLLYAVADEDDSIRSIAAAMRDRAFRRIEFDRSLLAAYVRFLEQPHAAPRVDDLAMAWFESRKFARLMSSNILLADSASGHEAARDLFRRWFPELTRTRRNADRVGALPPPQRGVFLPLFDALHQGQGQVWVTREVERLLASDDPGVRRLMAKLMTESATYGPMPLLQASLASGRPLGDAVLKETHLTPELACREIADVIESLDSTPRTRLAALATLRVIGLHGPEIRPAVEGHLADPDDAVRYAAAELLGRTDAMKQMRRSALLKDLRGNSPTLRLTAARQLDELGVEPKALTAALIRAIERRDMPVREGLLLALERAHASGHDALEMLKLLADTDDAADNAAGPTRAYARAALREIASAQ